MKNLILDNIKIVRNSRKISQQKMADSLNLSKSAYNQKENGQQNIRLSEILKILNMLDLELYANNIKISSIENLLMYIKEVRLEKGYTQDFMYQNMGLKSIQSYCNKENNKITIYLWEFIRICELLNIELKLDVPIIKEEDQNNIKNVRVQCLNNGKIYDSIKEAAMETGANHTLITKCCRGQRASAGRINGEKGLWEYV